MRPLHALLVLWAVVVAGQPAGAQHRFRHQPAPRASEPASAIDEPLDDRAIDRLLTRAAERFLREGTAAKQAELISQLSRQRCQLKPRAPALKNLSGTELVAKCQPGVLVVAGLYQCDQCPDWHTSAATGFMLDGNGLFATAYHVVHDTNNQALVIMSGDGRIAPVKEVLAADRRTDVAILRAEGNGYTALPLATRAPVGSKVRVISHPRDHYYTLSEGIVSRYFLPGQIRGRPDITMMAITADFARGSSGGPVFNEQGAVVAMVHSTELVYYHEDEKRKVDPQMVFKHCIPVRYLLELME